MLSILMGKASHAQSTQNNKFAKCSQYLKKELRNEVDFLHAYKQRFHSAR